jgi:nicotinamidase-related amidase
MANFEGWALIVVDMQNDFLAKDGYYARRERYTRV